MGAGFAVGIGAGIGSGIAMGVASGRKKATSEIQDYVERNGITILDRQKKELKLEEFLREAVGDQTCNNGGGKTGGITLLILLGLLIFGVIAAVMLYFKFAV